MLLQQSLLRELEKYVRGQQMNWKSEMKNASGGWRQAWRGSLIQRRFETFERHSSIGVSINGSVLIVAERALLYGFFKES